MSTEPPSPGPERRTFPADRGHFRRVRGLLTAGRVGSALTGSAWMVLTLGMLLGGTGSGTGGGIFVAFLILAVFVYLGGVITEVVGWFGLRGLEGHRGWATAVAVFYILECSWALVGPAFLIAAFRDPAPVLIATLLLVTSRAALIAIGFWMRRGAAARVAASAFSVAAIAWVILFIAAAADSHRATGAAIASAITAALCEGVGHFATGAYFIEKRPIPVDVSAFT